jgi:hypothetical protein
VTRFPVPFVALVLLAVPALALVETPAAPLQSTQVEAAAPAIASDGQNYLAVWADRRDPRRPALYGARITPDREVLDPAGVRLMEGSDAGTITAGLGRYFILSRSLRFVIVDGDANVVARGSIANEPAADRIQVVFNGSDFVAFWSKDAVRTATVDPFGNIVRWPDNVVRGEWPILQDAAIDGSRILVAYTIGSTLYVAGTSAEGQPLRTGKVVAGNVGWWTPASIAAGGGEFALAWLHHDVPDRWWEDSVRTIRLDADGNARGAARVAIPWPATPRIVHTTDGFRLFEAQELRVMSYELTTDLLPLTVVPAIDLTRPSTVREYAVAAGPGGSMVLAVAGPVNGGPGEVGLHAADGETAGTAVLVSRAGTTQSDPDVAIGGEGTLVAWRESERPRIAATFFGKDGRTNTFDVEENAYFPVVAAQDGAFVIAWSTNAGARARVVRDGAPYGESIALGSSAGALVAVAAEGRDFVIVSIAQAFGAPFQLTRIDIEGRVVARREMPQDPQAIAAHPSLACDGGECLLAWVQRKPVVPGCFSYKCTIHEQVLAAHLDAALLPRYASPVALTQPEPIVRVMHLDVAAADGDYAVAWELSNASNVRTVGRGQQLGPLVTKAGRHPAVERAGSGWLFVREAEGELLAAHFDGEQLRGEHALARDAQWRSAPALARHGDDVTIAYERTTIGEPAGGVVRAWLAPLAAPAPRRRSARF